MSNIDPPRIHAAAHDPGGQFIGTIAVPETL
jgi:hypothetical protein